MKKLDFEKFVKFGYAIVDVSEISTFDDLRSTVLTNLCQSLGVTNEQNMLDYLERNRLDDGQYLKVLEALHSIEYPNEYFLKIASKVEGLFKPILGENIARAKKPFIRVIQASDSRVTFEMHSDTFYGDSFFDIAIWCQLTKNINTPSLTVIPGSHLPKGGRYQEREINEEVGVFGDDSKGKGIGVPYRPVSLSYRQEETQDLIIPYGSVCIFFGSLLYKSAIHTSPQPRISFDFRLTPLLLPSTLRKNKANYFTPLYINKVTKSILDCYAQPIQDLL